jgi:hypothetical protein
MIRKASYIIIFLSAISIADASAQNSQILYHMNLPQNHLLNPALRPGNSVYIGLPVISGINLNINNNFVNFSDIFISGQPSDSIITFLHPDYDVNDFLDKVKNKNSLEAQFSMQLLGLGFSAGKNSYVFLDINERIEGNIVFPGDLFELALKGNQGFSGSSIDLASLRGDLKYYREVGLGYSKNISNKLRIGVKGKLLFGIAGISIANRSLEIDVSDNYAHTLDADADVNISGPMAVYTNDDQNIDSIVINDQMFNTRSELAGFILGKRNMGLGLDIGATYQVTDRIIVSAAITDLGFIKWKKDVTNLRAESRFEFSGLDMTDVINGTKTFDQAGDELIDSLKNSFILENTNDPFTTFLPVGVSLGGRYNLTNYFSLGLLSYTRVIGKQFRESFTMSANINISNAFSTSVSYTASNHRYDNLGFGLAFRPGIFQFYILTDRIPVSWNRITFEGDEAGDNSSILLPANWNTINLRLGMNLTFGNRVKKKNDRPMVCLE